MDIKQSFGTAMRNLFANKGRFAHAMLGTVIGVAGFVLALSCGSLSAEYISMQGDEYDPAVLKAWTFVSVDLPTQVMPWDMEKVAADNPEVIKGISPYVEFDFPGGVRYGEITAEDAQVYGVNGSYIDMLPVLSLREGRFFTDMDIARENKVCVIGSRLADELLGGDALGQTLKIWGGNYTVVGVFAEVAVEIERKRNSELYIPYTNALKMVGEPMDDYGNYRYTYFVCANGKENMYETQVLIKEMLQARTGREEKKGWILQAYSMGETSDKIKGYVIGQTVQLTFLAAVVLLVGGVGIMNVMLASVQARTKEIGIRKAFGATNRDIQRQFALEAVVTSLFGGGFGMALGLAGMFIMCRIADVSLSFLRVSIIPILAAFWVSTLIGVVFGIYPAKQAAKMEPVQAISCD